jgi:REP element-mobilizing transposase RayT
MAKTEHYFTKFEAGKYYHIYNRGVDRKPIFKQKENYIYFLTRIDKYLSQVLDLYAYSLLKNHFHLMVKIKDLTDFANSTLISEQDISKIVSDSFKRMFQSYAMAFNKKYNRVGTLFQTPFKRSQVDSDDYFTNLILYIHSNPQKHNLIEDFRLYQWSSYLPILKNNSDILHSSEVIDWFGGKDQYQDLHDERQKNLFAGDWDDDITLEQLKL